MRTFITVMVLLLAGMVWWSHRRPAPSGRVDDIPLQTPVEKGRRWAEKGYHFTPLADFQIHARVLSRKRYRGKQAELSPLDLAVGWGPLSDPAIYKSFKFHQSGRWYWWKQEGPLSGAEVVAYSANIHCIPATPALRKSLLAIRKDDFVRLEGRLVQIDGADGWNWTSSLSRTDTGARSCEVLWVDKVEVDL